MVAQYLYGLNAALITIRTFGHIMETKRNMGPIQIALFRIVADIGAIVGQFLAIILAFSLALTKLFVAEMSYNKKEKSQNRYSEQMCNLLECNPHVFWASEVKIYEHRLRNTAVVRDLKLL